MKVYFKLWLTVLALALGTLVMITLASQPARAAGPWYVAPGGDDGNACTSPGAACATINGSIAKASSGDTIYVATGTYTSTGSSEVVLLDKDATLSGGWDGTFTTQSGTSTIDGEGSRRGVTVNSGMTAMVERFTVQNGSADSGGGISNYGILTLNNSTVSGNTASDLYDGGGGISNYGILTLNDSTVSGNTSGFGGGGGIYNWTGSTLTLNNSTVSDNASVNGGGIRNSDGTVTLNNSTVSGNTAGEGGGIRNSSGTMTLNNSTVSDNIGTGDYKSWGGGIRNWDGTVNLNNSTVSGNEADGGGGISNWDGTVNLNNSTVSGNEANDEGGGISNYNWDGTVNLNNSTVSGNTATGYDGDGGGIYNADGTVTLNNSTVSGNTGDHGGGIYNNETVTTQNTILAGNTASGTGPDCSGYDAIGSSGYNLIGDTSGCTFTPTDGDLTNIDAGLGPLEGSPSYHPLLVGSPALDAGSCSGTTTDQRGKPRPVDIPFIANADDGCDIGSYEFDGVISVFLPIILRNY